MLKPNKLANNNFLSSLDLSTAEIIHILDIAKGKIILNTETIPVLLKDTNLHCLNKHEIERNYDKFMEIYS